jgi:hypothetical protein
LPGLGVASVLVGRLILRVQPAEIRRSYQGAFADSRGQAEPVVNLFGTLEGAAIEDDGSSRRGFENGRGVVDGFHADIILLRRAIEDRRWKQGGADRIFVEYDHSQFFGEAGRDRALARARTVSTARIVILNPSTCSF